MGHPGINALSKDLDFFKMGDGLVAHNAWDAVKLDIDKPGETRVLDITFQRGPIPENGVNGVGVETLIDVTIKRMEMHQSGEFACRENALVITKLQEALHWLDHRTQVREAQGVEGTDQVHT